MRKIKLAVIATAITLATACSNSEDARRALDAAGFTEIETHGHAWFACSDNDFYSTKFVAKNHRGRTVSGAVCSGLLFKNSTIRY